jgi:hypothetical protein
MSLTQPPSQVASGKAKGEWNIAVENADGAEVTTFSANDPRSLFTRLRAEYGAK